MIRIHDVVDGKYEILKEIGRGGMSTVYLAMDRNLNKQWAVKEIRKRGSDKSDQAVVNSLLVEAGLMKKLDHPALPRIVDIINTEETICIVMDYIEGETLESILKKYGAQPEDVVVDWAMQLCDVLLYLHSQRPPIIYRDMKPGNIMIKPEGNLKVFDFGIAREYKAESMSDTTVLGTKGYCPPEQYGSRQTDARSDIYALGMTMHHLLTGQDPRSPKYEYVPIRQYRPELSGSLERIINKCTALDPESRYQSCSELIYALQNREHDEDRYIRKQKRKLRTFITFSAMALVFALSGTALQITASNIDRNTYENLVDLSASSSYDEKISSYKQAIDIYPAEPEAYIKLLEAYEFEGGFTESQGDEFTALYNRNRTLFDTESAGFAELNYKAGMMYLNFYVPDKNAQDAEDVEFSVRVNKAYGFFQSNHENAPEGFAYQSISDCYYLICEFYRTYILTTTDIKEPTLTDYEELLSVLTETVTEIDQMEGVNAYDQLMMYNGTVMLLYDQRIYLESAGVPREDVIDLLDMVYEKSQALSVTQERSQNLKQEIATYHEDYRSAIETAYENALIHQSTSADTKQTTQEPNTEEADERSIMDQFGIERGDDSNGGSD